MTIEEAIAAFEAGFSSTLLGKPSAYGPTGEPYVSIDVSFKLRRHLPLPEGTEGRLIGEWFDRARSYAGGKGAYLYWRLRPYFERAPIKRGGASMDCVSVYGRLLVSEFTPIPEPVA